MDYLDPKGPFPHPAREGTSTGFHWIGLPVHGPISLAGSTSLLSSVTAAAYAQITATGPDYSMATKHTQTHTARRSTH